MIGKLLRDFWAWWPPVYLAIQIVVSFITGKPISTWTALGILIIMVTGMALLAVHASREADDMLRRQASKHRIEMIRLRFEGLMPDDEK